MWLKKVGLTVLKCVGVAAGFLPIAQAISQPLAGVNESVANLTDDLTKIAAAVQTVEVVVGAISDPNAKTGSQKLKAVTPLVAQIIQVSELMAGKKIKDEAAFVNACSTISGGVADLLNSLEPK